MIKVFGIVQHCECSNPTELFTFKLILCYVDFTPWNVNNKACLAPVVPIAQDVTEAKNKESNSVRETSLELSVKT
jgi:hypothetical protein